MIGDASGSARWHGLTVAGQGLRVKLAALVLVAGCGGGAEQPEPQSIERAVPAGCAEDGGIASRHAALDAIGHPVRDPKLPPSESLDDSFRLNDDFSITRWALRGAEVVWAAPRSGVPEGLHVVFGDDGERARGLVDGGGAVLWLPGPPERPETTELLLRRAKQPPARDALLLAWAAMDSARYGRFSKVPSGRILVHALGDPASAAWLAAFDPRVDGIVGLPQAAEDSIAPFAAAACKSISFDRSRTAVFPGLPPQSATDPLPSPEPAPWRVSLPPPSTAGEVRTAPDAWLVLGPVPEGLTAPHTAVSDQEPWGEGPDPRLAAAKELGVEAAAIGFVGAGAHGVVALRLAGAFDGSAVAIGSPATLWTDQSAAPAWPTWVFKPGGTATSDPWWLAAALGDRAVLVDPRDALGQPWTTPAPLSPVAASLDEAIARLSRD